MSALGFIRNTTIVLLALALALQASGQSLGNGGDEVAQFLKLLSDRPYFSFNPASADSKTVLPTIHKNNEFEIRLSDTVLNLKERRVVLENPYGGGRYPLSFSVIYKDRIVSLFEPGKFACYDLALNRDLAFEKRLNQKTFKYHWIIDNTLVAKSGKTLYSWSENDGWVAFQKNNPMNNQPKLFEDEKYIVYFHCNGEFGGTIYFYNKANKDIHVTEATCANSVNVKDNQYLVLTSLGHMMGNMKLKSIRNPAALPRLRYLRKLKLDGWAGSNIGYADSSKHSRKVFEFYQLLAFSSFRRGNDLLYWINWNNFNLLATIDKNVISIVDPLFIDHTIYTHDPVTTTYPNGTVLMNFDFYGFGKEREVSIILIDKDQITKVDWDPRL